MIGADRRTRTDHATACTMRLDLLSYVSAFCRLHSCTGDR